VRTDIKKKTGTVIDKFGNYVSEADAEATADGTPGSDLNIMMYNKKGTTAAAAAAAAAKKPAGEFKSIASYKPTGSLVYNNDLFKKIEERM
jgi:ribosomal protein L12E/L44/L45/RPP1/RPP2